MNATSLCACGCQQAAPLASRTDRRYGYVAGKPVSYIKGHNRRISVRLLDRIHARSRPERTDRSVDIGDCLVWTGSRGPKGYGSIKVDGHRIDVHRAAWIERHGQPPEEAPHVLHHCDNPPCFRDDHLFLGTNADNCADAFNKRTRCRRGHEYATNSKIRSDGRRICQPCLHARTRGAT